MEGDERKYQHELDQHALDRLSIQVNALMHIVERLLHIVEEQHQQIKLLARFNP